MGEKSHPVRKSSAIKEFGGCTPGATVTFDCHKIHYGQITIKGLFHTTPRVVQQSFDMLARGAALRILRVDFF